MSAVGFIVAEVIADSAFCIAAPEVAAAFDRPVALSPLDGAAVVPASGLIGGLRAYAEQAWGRDATDAVFGSGEAEDGGRSSVVRALGVTVRGADGGAIGRQALQRRSQTAIAASRASAVAGTLRHSQAVAPGAIMTLHLEVRDAAQTERVAGLIARWRPTIGASRTSGLGQASVRSVRFGVLDPATPAGRRTMIEHGGPQLVATVASTPVQVESPGRPPIRTWSFDLAAPLLVRGERTGNKVSALVRGGQPVIDGSTWKGIFRHRAQFIVDSAAAAAGREPTTSAVDLLFGTTRRRGLLWFSETEVNGSLAARPRPHVAIDRVTGGARDERLFTDQPVDAGRVELRVLAERELPPWAGVLLDAVVADIADGLVGIGGATSRGYGSLALVGERPRSSIGHVLDAVLAGEVG